MSPEQNGLLAEFKKLKATDHYSEFRTLKETKQLTPAVSDNYQASLVILEMHARGARWVGSGAVSVQAAILECASRSPEDQVSALSPPEAEEWVVDRLGLNKFAGKIESNAIDGARLLEIAKMRQGDAAAALGVKMALAKAPQLAIRRSVTALTDTMHEKVSAMLTKGLAVDVGARPASAREALKMLDAVKYGRIKDDLSSAVSGSGLHPTATTKAAEHPHTTVATTLGGLSKALVLHGDVLGTLLACAEWWGVASSGPAREEAAKAYCNLWKRHGEGNFNALDLSRGGRGHWREGMLSGGEEIVKHLFSNVMQSGASIEWIDLPEQPKLEGAVIGRLFEFRLESLTSLKVKKCKLVSGVIPRAIEQPFNLRILELVHCGLRG